MKISTTYLIWVPDKKCLSIIWMRFKGLSDFSGHKNPDTVTHSHTHTQTASHYHAWHANHKPWLNTYIWIWGWPKQAVSHMSGDHTFIHLLCPADLQLQGKKGNLSPDAGRKSIGVCRFMSPAVCVTVFYCWIVFDLCSLKNGRKDPTVRPWIISLCLSCVVGWTVTSRERLVSLLRCKFSGRKAFYTRNPSAPEMKKSSWRIILLFLDQLEKGWSLKSSQRGQETFKHIFEGGNKGTQ